MATSAIHLKIDGIKGESADSKHKDEIDVESWSWGASNSGSVASGSGGGAGAGKVTFTDLSFAHRVDKASTSLWKACATGAHIKEATLTSAKKGKSAQDFLIIRMSDVLVTSVSMSETSGTPPMELVALQFAKVDFEYKPQKADGSLDAGVHFKYDIQANKEG